MSFEVILQGFEVERPAIRATPTAPRFMMIIPMLAIAYLAAAQGRPGPRRRRADDPADGEVTEGVASVDESAIKGESAPVIREAGGDRSAVTSGTRVLSDVLTIRITSNPGESFLDCMIALVEGAERQKTPNEIALNILLARLTIIFVLAVVTSSASHSPAPAILTAVRSQPARRTMPAGLRDRTTARPTGF